MEKENKTVKGYKGFDKNLRCRDFQYEIGKEYETERAELCREGFHFCENPHDVLSYYSAGEGNRFAVVEASEVSDEKEDDSKRVSKRISVKAEISVFEICRIAVSAFFENFGFKKKIESADTNNAGTAVQPMQGTAVQPMQGTAVQPMQGTAVQPMQGTAVQPMQGTVVQPMQGTTVQPMQGTAVQPMQGTAVQPMQGTTVQPMQGTAVQP